MATIREVSRLSGVSIATVSRVMNHMGNVSEQTTRKVMRAVEELSFQINPIASNLKGGRSRTIGVVLPHMDNYYFMRVLEGIERVTAQHASSPMLAVTGNQPEKERRILENLLSFRVDGLIVATSLTSAEDFRAVRSGARPLVLIDRRIDGMDVDMISEENIESGALLTRQLICAGHRRIAIFTGDMRLRLMRERLEGCLRALREEGIAAPDDSIVHCENLVESGEARASETFSVWQEAGKMPTALVCLNSNVTEGVMLCARSRGLAIPRDLSIVSFGVLRSPLIEPSVTSVVQDGFRVGTMAAERLFKRIEQGDEEIAPRNMILENGLFSGTSVLPPRNA